MQSNCVGYECKHYSTCNYPTALRKQITRLIFTLLNDVSNLETTQPLSTCPLGHFPQSLWAMTG